MLGGKIMKQTKIKGFIRDLENRNKNYSFDKIIKLLDASNYIYLELMNKIRHNEISEYKGSKYIFNEIINEFKLIYELLEKGEVISSICLLRNTYEEILYVMASSLNVNLEIDAETAAGYFKRIVVKNINELLSDNITEDDIKEIYSYLSKLTHITNLKEAVSYLIGNSYIKKYIVNEIKYILIFIEYLYLDFMYKKLKLDKDLIDDIIAISSYPEILNVIYFGAYSSKTNRKLMRYFYGEKNQKYLKDLQEKFIKEFKNFKIEKNNMDLTLKQVSKEVDKKLVELNYIDKVKEILNN